MRGCNFSILVLLLALSQGTAAQTQTLLDLYAKAVERDPRVNIAELQVEVGEAQLDQATGMMLPQVTATAQFSENEVAYKRDALPREEFDGERYAFVVRQMLFNWSTISARSRAAKVRDQRDAELLDTLRQISVDVTQRYFSVLLADDDVRLLERERELVESQLKEISARYDRSLVPVTELLETRARMDQVSTDLIQAENTARIAREELTIMVGQRVEAIADLRDNYVLPPLEGSMDEWLSKANANNAELIAQESAVEAARSGIEESRGQQLPTVSFVASAQRSDLGFDNLRAPQRDVVYFGVDLTVPLFAGGANTARLRESWSNYYIALEQQEGVRRDVDRLVRSAWLNADASRRRMEAAAKTVESASTAYEANKRAFGLGQSKSVDVLEALHRVTRARRDLRQALYEYLFHWVSLKREAGELEPEHMELITETVLAD